MIKILLATTHLNTGGIGIYVLNLARHLKALGADVSVLSSGGDLEGTLGRDGIPHIGARIRTKSEFGISVMRAIPIFTRVVKDNAFDIVHAQTRVTQVLAGVSRHFSGVPFVTTCHGFFNYKRAGRALFPFWGERTIAISRNVFDHLVNDFHVPAARVRLIRTGIEVDRFLKKDTSRSREIGRLIGLKEGKTTVGSVGRLSSVKGYKFLLEAFKKVMAAASDVQLLIIGGGPEKIPLLTLADRLGIAGNVFFVEGDTAILEHYLSLMDVFCLPSIAEGLGLAVMEAMASGCACVASEVGGLKELIIPGKDGLLVPPGDPESLSAAIVTLLRNKEMRCRFGENARQKALMSFSVKDSAAGTLSLYGEVLAERKKGNR